MPNLKDNISIKFHNNLSLLREIPWRCSNDNEDFINNFDMNWKFYSKGIKSAFGCNNVNDNVNTAFIALGLKKEDVVYVGENGMDWLIEVNDEDIIPKIKPDFYKIQTIPKVRCVIVTAKSNGTKYRNENVEYVNRVFSSYEDPVTGSAHCFLSCHWAKKLNIKNNTTFKGYQASKRGGIVSVTLTDKDRCLLGGRAVTVMNIDLFY